MTDDEAKALLRLLGAVEKREQKARRKRAMKKAAIYASMPLLGPLAGDWLAEMDRG